MGVRVSPGDTPCGGEGVTWAVGQQLSCGSHPPYQACLPLFSSPVQLVFPLDPSKRPVGDTSPAYHGRQQALLGSGHAAGAAGRWAQDHLCMTGAAQAVSEATLPCGISLLNACCVQGPAPGTGGSWEQDRRGFLFGGTGLHTRLRWGPFPGRASIASGFRAAWNWEINPQWLRSWAISAYSQLLQ